MGRRRCVCTRRWEEVAAPSCWPLTHDSSSTSLETNTHAQTHAQQPGSAWSWMPALCVAGECVVYLCVLLFSFTQTHASTSLPRSLALAHAHLFALQWAVTNLGRCVRLQDRQRSSIIEANIQETPPTPRPLPPTHKRRTDGWTDV